MTITELKVETTLSVAETIRRLEELNGKENFINSITNKKLFAGSISKENISLRTFDSPPVEISGLIKEHDNHTQLILKLKGRTNEASLKGLTYGFGYPIASIIIFFILYNDPRNLLSYLLCALVMIAPFVLFKINYLMNYAEPDLENISSKIKYAIQN